jgi:hypothetical protein
MALPLSHLSRPFVARKYGPSSFERFDHLSAASLGSRELGKVLVDCRFRLSQSKWGTLGDDNNPAGILYMDLSFNQPKDCRLSSATVLVTLEYDPEPDCDRKVGTTTSNCLQVTEWFGPKELRGPEKIMMVKKIFHFTPNVNALGNGAGGVGIDTEKTSTHNSRWTFSGQILPGKDKRGRSVRGAAYRTLKWELNENELESRSIHNNVIHTAFTFEHEGKPFYLRVKIKGKLQRTKDRIKHHLKFPPDRNKGQGSTLTLISLGKGNSFSKRLDKLASGLPIAMQKENQDATPLEMQDTLPASFQEEPINTIVSNNLGNAVGSKPPSLLQGAPLLAIEDQTIQNLSKAILAFCNTREPERYLADIPSTLQRKRTVEQTPEREFLEAEVAEREVETAQGALLRFAQFAPFLLMVQFLASLLEIFGGKGPSNPSMSSESGRKYIEDMDEAITSERRKAAEKLSLKNQTKYIEDVDDSTRRLPALIEQARRHETRESRMGSIPVVGRESRKWRS